MLTFPVAWKQNEEERRKKKKKPRGETSKKEDNIDNIGEIRLYCQWACELLILMITFWEKSKMGKWEIFSCLFLTCLTVSESYAEDSDICSAGQMRYKIQMMMSLWQKRLSQSLLKSMKNFWCFPQALDQVQSKWWGIMVSLLPAQLCHRVSKWPHRTT